MEEKTIPNLWSAAARAGLYTGGAVILVSIVGALLRLDITASWLMSLLTYVAIAAGLYIFASCRAGSYGARGFTYGQSMGYMLAILLFAGILIGAASYVMHALIWPEYYREAIETAVGRRLAKIPGIKMEQIEDGMAMGFRMMKNPLVMIFSGTFNTVFIGGLMSLILSVFVQKKGDPFAE